MFYCLYFCNWSIYERKFTPDRLPADQLTHVFYAFAKTDLQTGQVSLSDPWADIEKPMPLGGAGCLGELAILKQRHPQLRVVMSIGGWTYSSDLTAAFASPDGRQRFAESAVALIDEHGLDGVDVDWEYPETEEQAAQLVNVLARLRHGLNELAAKRGVAPCALDLTVAAPAGPDQRRVLDIPAMNKYLSFWNLMTYDFSGPWSPAVAHHANLYGEDQSVDKTISFYVSGGIPPQNIVLGMPLYGRSFAHTTGLSEPFAGTLKGQYAQGVHDLCELPIEGAAESIDEPHVAAYCQGPDFYVTFDNAETLRRKARYVRAQGLGGGMWWEASGDRLHKASAVRAFVDELESASAP